MIQRIGVRPRTGAAPLRTTAQTRALLTVCAVLFLTFLDTTIVSVALADVQTTLHASVPQLQWVVNGYALAFASLMLAAGGLADRVGRKKVMVGGMAVFALGSLLGALAPSPNLLIASRVVMGIGAAASEPGTLSIIRHVYPERASRARALGLWAATSGLALALGPVIGGVLVDLGSWRTVFYFNLVLGATLVLATVRLVPESRDPSGEPFDFAGLGAVTLLLSALTFAVIVGENSGYGDVTVVALFVIGAVAAIAFVLAERRAKDPLLDLKYLKSPRFSGALAVAFALFFGIFSIFFFTALYLQIVVNYSAARTALEFAPMALALIVGALTTGRIVAAIGPRVPMVLGSALAGGGTLGADALLNTSGQPSGFLLLTLAIAGFGFGMSLVPVTSVTLGVVPPQHSGMAASATNTSRELGAVFGVAVLGALVNANLTSDLTSRLHALGIPSAFQAIVIGAVETGGLPAGGGAGGAASTYGPIVNKVIHAAYGAFRDGLDVSLLASGLAMIGAALVAAVTAPTRQDLEADAEGLGD